MWGINFLSNVGRASVFGAAFYVGLAGAVWAQEPEAPPEAPQPSDEQQEAPAPEQPPIPVPSQEASATQQQSLCEKAGPETDICQQWRMAEAAEKQFALLGQQYELMWIETGALILTLLATAAAAGAAAWAARAAIADTKIAAQNAILQYRPKLIVRHIQEHLSDDRLFSVTLRISNVGGSPAEIVEGRAILAPGSPPRHLDGPQKAKPIEMAGSVQPGEMAGPFTVESSGPWAPSDPHGIHLTGYVLYKDSLGIVRRTAFCRKFANGYWIVRPNEHPDSDYAD